MMCDILWSDPFIDQKSGELLPFKRSSKNIKKDSDKTSFIPNDERNCSYYFNFNALKLFLEKNNLLSLIRAHEVKLEGFQHHTLKNEAFPLAITIFSAPQYCGYYQNKAAFLSFVDNKI